MKNGLDKELFEFLELHKDVELTDKEKKDAVRIYKNFEKYENNMRKESDFTVIKNDTKRKAFFKYFSAVAASIILCVSVLLPITINAINKPPLTIYLPENNNSSNNPRYQSDATISTDYENLANLGFLLFENNVQAFSFESVCTVEYTTQKAGLPLSYVIEDILVLIKDAVVEDTFTLDYRIRTYKEYDFPTYYTDFFATLERLYEDKMSTIIEKDTLYEFINFEIIESQETKFLNNGKIINAFICEGIVIFYHVQQSGDTAFIYFVCENNEYMISLSKDINAESEHQKAPTAEYIKDHFIPALFRNLPNIAAE